MRRFDWFLVGLVLSVALAWAIPGPGSAGGALHPELSNKLSVALIFFFHGALLSPRALGQGLLNWRAHLVTQSATFLAFPLLGWLAATLLARWLGAPLALGVFFLSALPSTVSSSVALTAAARGNVAMAVFNATLSSVIGIFITPAWVGLFAEQAGGSLPIASVVLDLMRWLMLPLALGQSLRPLIGRLVERHRAKVSVVDRLAILLLVYTSFCDSVEAHVWSSYGVGTLALVFSIDVALLAVMLFGTAALTQALGFSREDRIAVVFCGSKKTLASGVPLARLLFAGSSQLGLLLLPILLYHSLQLIVASWLAARLVRRRRVAV
jgi:sodium/bile acid cotransporter 7